MRPFCYREGKLFCENVFLKDIADKVKTPFYVYSYNGIIYNFNRMKNALSRFNPLICYSLKANSSIALCKILSSLGAGADVVSGGELYLALCAGFPPQKIVYAGVGKTSEEIEYALEKNILLFNVESEEELEEIATISSRLGKKANIALRVNPDVDPETHDYITTGKIENKFGIDLEKARKLFEKIKKIKSLSPRGIHMHIGSQIKSIQPYIKAIQKVKEFIEEIQKKIDIKLDFFDIGGGFGIAYREEEKDFPLEEFADKITHILPKNMRLIVEPGRYIVGNSGVLLTKVLYRKKGREKYFIVVDAGMNDLIRPSLYGTYHRVLPVEKESPHNILRKVSIVGPVCESGDFFVKDFDFPEIKKEKLIAILDAGAYGFSMSSNYNARPRCSEVLVKEEKWWVIREREEYEDLLKNQKFPDFIIPFWKMEATGNDFIVIDNRDRIISDRKEAAIRLCNRKKGIGADGLILIEEAEGADFFMRIFNPDGSEAEMCGNGARCAARFAYLKGIAGKICHFKTLSGIIEAKIDGEDVKIKMTDPSKFRKISGIKIDEENHSEFEGYYINTGVPHFVIFSSNLESISVKRIGSKIRFNRIFHPLGTNVDFVETENKRIKIRTYERGVEDETLSCGTGAAASAIVASIVKNLSPPISVLTRGGEVKVWFQKKEGKIYNVFLEGKANKVYKGYLNGGKNV